MTLIKFVCSLLVLYLIQVSLIKNMTRLLIQNSHFFQTSLAKPAENSANFTKPLENNTFTAKEKLMIYTGTEFFILGSIYAEKSVNITKEILKDQDLLASNKPEILVFKKNLTTFLESLEVKKDLEHVFDVSQDFANITKPYLELPKEKETTESKFIGDLLNKYHVKVMRIQFEKDFDTFLKYFERLFEAAKNDIEKPILEWHKQFVVLNDFDKKYKSFVKFLHLI